jgi:hypothetical protein
MKKQDYLIRQIDQLGCILGKILYDLLGLKIEGKLHLGTKLIQIQLKKALGISDFTGIPSEDFLEIIQLKNTLSNDSLETLADHLFLLAEEEAYQNNSEEKIHQLFERAHIIYQHLENTESTYSLNRHYKMDKIKSHFMKAYKDIIRKKA